MSFFVVFMHKRGNGPTCATSNRSRERENKNENRDNYLHEYNIISLLKKYCNYMNSLLTIAFFERFLSVFWDFLGFLVSKREDCITAKILFALYSHFIKDNEEDILSPFCSLTSMSITDKIAI